MSTCGIILSLKIQFGKGPFAVFRKKKKMGRTSCFSVKGEKKVAAKKKNDALEKALKIKAESSKTTFMAAAGIDENETDEIIEEKFEDSKIR